MINLLDIVNHYFVIGDIVEYNTDNIYVWKVVDINYTKNLINLTTCGRKVNRTDKVAYRNIGWKDAEAFKKYTKEYFE
jgi:hypothetical protein